MTNDLTIDPTELPEAAAAAADLPGHGSRSAASAAASAEPDGVPDWLPGVLRVCDGTSGDYRELAHLHYRAGRPATWAAVVAVRHWVPGREGETLAAVGVLSWPTAASRGRSLAFGLGGMTYGDRLRWANANVRTISRVVVRPRYRGAGLAAVVIAELVRRCPTPFCESTAAMGAFHPMFERAGMARVAVEGGAPYFWCATGGGCDDAEKAAIGKPDAR